MFQRAVNILKSNSFFLFGARATGKTFLLRELFPKNQTTWIDLLRGETELRFGENPDALSEVISAAPGGWVVIDEVQKVPKLLDVVHREIEDRRVKFALTGSSARKLKRGGANLLAGRAFVYHLFPLTHHELGESFNLLQVLQWGSLPKLYDFSTDQERKLFLTNYVETYLTEEVFAEQLTRKVLPFRKFLKVAAQSNGTVLNFARIAQDLALDSKTVRTYFDILEDTLVGFYLPATEKSFRKQQLKSPKFYLFDTGVKRAIEGVSHFPLNGSQEIGPIFEHWIITELFRYNSYAQKPFEFSYLLTKGGLEVDLVLEAPREEPIFIEIKSTRTVTDRHLANLNALRDDFPKARYMCISQESHARIHNGIEVLPWNVAFKELGLAHL